MHEWRKVTNFAAIGGVVTHEEFTAQLEEGDAILIVNPVLYEPMALNNLSAQNVRDAMKLDCTGNAPAAGSVDKHLDDIEADTDELQSDDIPGILSTNDTSIDNQLEAIKAETVLIVV
ncbi:unnamed protein product [marine sediment metagenome]|uniref:Uncharacterized protein n=1 Tax=marine sediment metagenome TaxID=412755 RepID=X1SUX3_9ZZZZ